MMVGEVGDVETCRCFDDNLSCSYKLSYISLFKWLRCSDWRCAGSIVLHHNTQGPETPGIELETNF